MTPLQEKLLEMLTWLDAYMNKQGLRYYLAYGSFLGAVRHKGFIPWDDDIDIVMPRPDYEKLLDLLEKPVDHYVVESPRSKNKDFSYSYGKLYDTNTTMTEISKNNIVRGVFIDIFPLDGIGNNLEESKQRYKKVTLYNAIGCMKKCSYSKKRVWWKNIAALLGYIIPLSEKYFSRKLDKVYSTYDYDDNQYVGCLAILTADRAIVDKRIFGKPTLYEFEGRKFYGPEKYDEYLKICYGDWRKLPPKEQQKPKHDFIDVDLEKPYMIVK